MRRIHTPNAPEAVGPYSQGVVSGGLLYTAGQIALTTEGRLLEGDITAQTHQVMGNLGAILKAENIGFENVVSTRIYLDDVSRFAAMNKAYGEYFPENTYPVRECVEATIPLPGSLVEISMVAELPRWSTRTWNSFKRLACNKIRK